MDRKPIHDMTAEEIAEITEAFTDYPYKTGERGLKDILGGREKQPGISMPLYGQR